jgi:hypothetical protein
MKFNLSELEKEYINGTLFTKSNLNNKFFLLTKQFITDEKVVDMPTFMFKIFQLNPSNIKNIENRDFSKLRIKDFETENTTAQKTTYLKQGVVADLDFVNNEDAEIGRMNIILKKDGNFHLTLLQVCKNYREYGFSSVFIDALKGFAHVNHVDQVTGLLCPLDKLVYKNVLYPARQFPPMILKPHNLTEEYYDGVKSADVLEKIYKNLGFSVDRNKTQEIGRLYLNTRNVNEDENYERLKTNLCLEENFHTGSHTLRKGLLDVYIDPKNESTTDDISEYILPDNEFESNNDNEMETL